MSCVHHEGIIWYIIVLFLCKVSDQCSLNFTVRWSLSHFLFAVVMDRWRQVGASARRWVQAGRRREGEQYESQRRFKGGSETCCDGWRWVGASRAGHPDESSPALSFIYTNVLLSRQFRKCHINKRLNLSTQSVTTDYISLTNQTARLFLRLLMTFFNV